MAARGFVAVLVACLVTGVLSQTVSIVGPSYPPSYPPSSNGGGSAGSSVNSTANVRFFGPLSAGCRVVYEPELPHTLTGLGSLTAPNSTIAGVVNCTDVLTGQPIPITVGGVSPATPSTFQVNVPSTIAVAASEYINTAQVYNQLGLVDPNVNLQTADVMQLLVTPGKLRNAFAILRTDLSYIALNVYTTKAFLNATRNSPGSSACREAMDIEVALGNVVSSLVTPLNFSDVTSLRNVVSSLSHAPCLFPADLVSTLAPLVAQYAVGVSAAIRGLKSQEYWPVSELALLTRVASLLSKPDLLTITAAMRNKYDFLFAVDEAPIVPIAVASAMGINTYTAVDTTVHIQFTGPLRGVNISYTPFHALLPTLFSTGQQSTVSIPAAVMASYAIEAGAVDTFLTTSDVTVTTRIPFYGIVSFTGTGGKIVLSPVSTLVTGAWLRAQAAGPAPPAPGPESYRAVLERITGTLPTGDFMARDYTPGSGAALAVYVCDVLIPTIPSLGGVFISNALGADHVDDIVMLLFDTLVGKPATFFTNGTAVMEAMKGVYMRLKADPRSSLLSSYTEDGPRRRHSRRLQQTAQDLIALDSVFTSIASAISDSNSLVTDVITQAQAAIAAGTTPPASLFVTLAQVASVQSVGLANTIAAIAARVAASDYAGAQAAATTAASQYTGAALRTAVAAAPVNDAAITQAITPTTPTPAPTPTPTPPAGESATSLALPLGIALGVGIPVLVAAIAGTTYYIKKRRAAAITSPAPTAESVEQSPRRYHPSSVVPV